MALATKTIHLDYVSTGIMAPHVHGLHTKDLAVLHETISPDYPGMKDILEIEKYLASKDYGIHGMTDLEGHKAWALGLGRAVFYQAGGVNERSVGIEQVSNVPVKYTTDKKRALAWAVRKPELRATAQLLAAWHNSNPKGHPLRYCNSLVPGVTSHWDVSQHFSSSEGHWDCHPLHKGGYYPILEVITMANAYARLGLHFGRRGGL